MQIYNFLRRYLYVGSSTKSKNILWKKAKKFTFNKKLHPEYDDEKTFEECHFHLNDKFGENGYAKFFFKDEEYEKFLKDIRELLSDKKIFIETQKNYINELKAKGVI